jgi:hypothetical protein
LTSAATVRIHQIDVCSCGEERFRSCPTANHSIHGEGKVEMAKRAMKMMKKKNAKKAKKGKK